MNWTITNHCTWKRLSPVHSDIHTHILVCGYWLSTGLTVKPQWWLRDRSISQQQWQHITKIIIHSATEFERTTMVPSLAWFLWNEIMSANGKSQMTSLFRTKKESEFSSRMLRARARGPAAAIQTHKVKAWHLHSAKIGNCSGAVVSQT